MEYAQERIATLHDLTGSMPAVPTEEAAVVVPMAEREYRSAAAEHVLSKLELVAPGRVVVALRAPEGKVAAFADWLSTFDLPLSLLWCNAPAVTERLVASDLANGSGGKGRDVWLALGVAAATHDYVVVHDADAMSYSTTHVPRLLAPLVCGYEFSKGYYARVEDGRLYGRLFRLLYAPLVRALADRHDPPALSYLGAFRYALAGEFAMTAELATRVRIQRHWGLEVGTLGEAFAHAGFDGTAQVDLGTHEHDHRTVGGPTGLSEMSGHVAAALFRVVEEHGGRPDYATLPARYREVGATLVDQYAADAAFNGLEYDAASERDQIETYAEAIRPPGKDTRLPAWTDTSLDPSEIQVAAHVPIDGELRQAKPKR